MIGHTLLGTSDLAAARGFPDGLMAAIAAVPFADELHRVFYGTDPQQPMFGVTQPFDGQPASAGNGTMIALPLASREDVDRVHAKALELGGSDEGAPGLRLAPAAGLYFSYVRDPDGNKLAFFKIGLPDRRRSWGKRSIVGRSLRERVKTNFRN